MNTDYHDDLIMKKIFAFFASLREIIEFFQWTQSCTIFPRTRKRHHGRQYNGMVSDENTNGLIRQYFQNIQHSIQLLKMM
jgi:hypothetical protein